MKQLLLKTFSVTLLLAALYLPHKSLGQCLCSGGVAPNMIENIVVLDTIHTSSTVISFPKFDPAIGALNCVRLDDTISVVSTNGIRNLDPDSTEYAFILTVTTNVSGPSLSRTNSKTANYGPDFLSGFGNPGDTINYGPDTLYKDFPSTKTNSTNTTPYLGSTGNVNFNYAIGGGTVAFGGANFNAQMRTSTWGIFKLTYYWCPNIVLASGIKSFSATKKDNTVELSWLTVNDTSSNNQYQIQTSKDGKNFTTLEQAGNTNVTEGASTKYHYQYTPDQPVNGKLYFRIKQTDGASVKYSVVRSIQSGENIPESAMKVYPNPAAQHINLSFDEPLTGNLLVEISNQMGQVVYSGNMKVNNATQLQVGLKDIPPSGIYFLRARNAGTDKVYSAKLVVQK